MSFVATPTRTFSIAANTPLNPHLRMKLNNTGLVSLAAANENDVGTLDSRVLATDTRVTLRLPTAEGTQKMVANAAVAVGAKVFTAAAGKVGATSTGSFIRGVALTAAAADGDVIEVLSHFGMTAQA